MSCRRFGLGAGGKAHVEVFIYDMGSAPNAFAVFSGQRRPGSPSSSLTANAYATANALFFTQGRFYVEIVADRASETLQKSLGVLRHGAPGQAARRGRSQERGRTLPQRRPGAGHACA